MRQEPARQACLLSLHHHSRSKDGQGPDRWSPSLQKQVQQVVTGDGAMNNFLAEHDITQMLVKGSHISLRKPLVFDQLKTFTKVYQL